MISKWIAHALVLQLFLVSLSFPVLVCWGIGFSPLIFLGNIIFTPLLTLFLALSGSIFILEFFCIPADFLCWLLDGLTFLWVRVMALAPHMPLVGGPQAPWWVLMLMPLGAWVIVRTYGFKDIYTTLFFLALWVGIVFGGVKWYFTPQEKEIILLCGSKKIHAHLRNRKVTLTDSECALNSRAFTQTWLDYTLSPTLMKHFGSAAVDTLIIAKATPKMVSQAKRLCGYCSCQNLRDLAGNELQI
jgi:hypothetical protein